MIASEVPNALRDRNAAATTVAWLAELLSAVRSGRRADAAQARRELDRLGVAIHLRMYPPHDRPRNEGVRR